MDPLTALSLAAGIVAFIDFSCKIVAGAGEIRGSASGITENGRGSERLATEMRAVTEKLKVTINQDGATDEEKALCRIAAECDLISKQILALLDKSKARPGSSPRSPVATFAASFRASFRGTRQAGELSRLQQRLDSSRSQLHLQLSHFTSAQYKARLDALLLSASLNADKVIRIDAQIEQLRKGVDAALVSPGAVDQLKALLQVADLSTDELLQQRFVASFAKEDMHRRYQAVEFAHGGTFSWILDDPEEPCPSSPLPAAPEIGGFRAVMDDAKIEARDCLQEWLSSGSGIFHIAGKLGSGKSTLIKYLWVQKRTKELLQQWSGNRKLVLAKIFFWKFGSDTESTLLGMIRSLVHGVLSAVPELYPTLFPAAWKSAKKTPMNIHGFFVSEDLEHLSSALNQLFSNADVSKDYRFCLFIDGLDEHNETTNQDNKFMVDLLLRWTRESLGALKICLSSREHNVFVNAFRDFPSIRLQNVTRSDMVAYATDRLRDIDDATGRTLLVDSIVKNSSGIFLWVAVVTKRMRAKFDDGFTDVQHLLQELEELPREMKDLYAHIINSQSESDRRRSYMTMDMVLAAHCGDQAATLLSLVAYYFFEDYIRDPDFAINAILEGRHFDTCSSAELDLRNANTRKRLNGCSKGLVEIVDRRGKPNYYPPARHDLPFDFPSDQPDERLEFTHRSVVEFLTEDPSGKSAALRGKFNAVDAVANLVLAEMWLRPGLWDMRMAHIHYRWPHQSTTDPHIRYTEAWAAAVAPMRERMSRLGEPAHGPQHHGWGPNALNYHRASHWAEIACEMHYFPQHPIYPAAATRNLQYVRWRLEQGFDEASPPDLSMLSRAALTHHRDLPETLDLLFRMGLSPETPSTPSELVSLWDNEACKPTVHRPTISAWHCMLLECYQLCFVHMAELHARRKDKYPKGVIPGGGLLFEKHLEHGASRRLHMYIAGDGRVSISTGDEPTVYYMFQEKFEPTNADERTRTFTCLADFFTALKFPNLERLLELCQE